MDNSRRRSGRRRRRRTREDHDYFEFADEDVKPPEDALEQRSVGMLVLFVVALLLVVCFLVIIRSCEVETFPI
jgi:hypothetical protein